MRIPPAYLGVAYAIGSAALFGASTPLAKSVLPEVGPWLLAGLLYLGSGLGLMLYRLFQSNLGKAKVNEAPLSRADVPWLSAAILCGGIIGPVLLMVGLETNPLPSALSGLASSARALNR